MTCYTFLLKTKYLHEETGLEIYQPTSLSKAGDTYKEQSLLLTQLTKKYPSPFPSAKKDFG